MSGELLPIWGQGTFAGRTVHTTMADVCKRFLRFLGQEFHYSKFGLCHSNWKAFTYSPVSSVDRSCSQRARPSYAAAIMPYQHITMGREGLYVLADRLFIISSNFVSLRPINI